MNFRLFSWLFLLLGASACTTSIVPADPDIPVVSYQTDISPIIAANCALADGCHDGNSDLAPLLTHSDLLRYVKPGDPYNSSLYTVIRSYTSDQAMPPKPSDPLTDKQIAQIYVWILQGATDQ